MNRKQIALTVVLTFAFTSGCGINGKWDLKSVEPTAAEREVKYHSMRLEKDGSFYAEAKQGEAIRTTSGIYTFGDGVLNLESHNGERNTYDADLRDGGKTLHLASFWEGRKLDLKYDRKAE